jgi:hypothetical protein
MSAKDIYFLQKSGNKITFREFLIREKISGRYSAKALSAKCGVNNIDPYWRIRKDGTYPTPSYKTFVIIVRNLGYTEDDFEFDRYALVRGKPRSELSKETASLDYSEQLQILGDRILEITSRNLKKRRRPQKLSTTIIRDKLGNVFAREHASGPEQLAILHQDLVSSDPRFAEIEFGYMRQQKVRARRLERFEIDCINETVVGYVGEHGMDHNHFPSGIMQRVENTLNLLLAEKDLPPRSYQAVVYHVNKIWNPKERTRKFNWGSPPESANIADQIIMEQTERFMESDFQSNHDKKVREAIAKPDIGHVRRDNFRKFSTVGHTNLIAFLMEPDNYHDFISHDAELFEIDFPESVVDEALREKYTKVMLQIKERQDDFPDGLDVIDFVDSWLRCDMIFKKKSGGFIVVEVKQYAINRPNGFQNATKACQQLAAYAAVILDNILRFNNDIINGGEYTPIKESVEGCLAAYEMEASVTKHLNRAGNKRPVIVPKAIVDTYISKIQKG